MDLVFRSFDPQACLIDLSTGRAADVLDEFCAFGAARQHSQSGGDDDNERDDVRSAQHAANVVRQPAMAYTSTQKIRFDDVDGAGIVYYPRFLHLCHAAFEDFFDDVAPFGYPALISDRRLGFPTVHIDADFKAPLAYGDIAIVTLTVTRVGTSSVKTHYEIHRKRDAVLCFTAEITAVLINLDSGTSLPLTDELKAVFSRYLVAPSSV